jgi:phenylalanyl-tRNA synthetase beta chain
VLGDAKDMILSMPPIINSKEAAMTINTKNLFIDVTGTDRKTVKEVLNMVVTALADRGGKIHSVIIEYPKLSESTPDLSPTIMKLDVAYANRLLGIKLSLVEAQELLKKMNFDAVEFLDSQENFIEVTVPPYRTDIMHPIDLVEDVAIAYGYQNFQPELPKLATIGEEAQNEVFSRKVMSIMTGLGFQEALTYILSNNTKLFANMKAEEQQTVKTVNPRTVEFTSVRNWLLPSLLEALAANQHNLFPQKLAEAGDCVILDSKSETSGRTIRKLAAVICHDTANLTECKSVVEAVMNSLGLKYDIDQNNHPSFIPSRLGEILVGGKSAGYFGEIHPAVLANWKLEKPVIAIELDLEALRI